MTLTWNASQYNRFGAAKNVTSRSVWINVTRAPRWITNWISDLRRDVVLFKSYDISFLHLDSIKPTKKTYWFIPVLEDPNIMHIATVALISVRAPKPFAIPKKTYHMMVRMLPE